MSFVEALILGLVQGLTEFIPVSSSGHLLLSRELFGSSEDQLVFDVLLHVGTLLALLVFFRNDIVLLAKNVFSKNKQGRLARLIVVATVPAALAGLVFGDFIEEELRSPAVVAAMLALVALLMLYVDGQSKRTGGKKHKEADVTQQQGMTIGVAQMLALIPGTSRSGITMTVGMLLGLGRVQAARFSFLLAIPIIAGSAVGIMISDSSSAAGVGTSQLIVGILASFVSGLAAIALLLKLVATQGLRPFAIYRLVLAAVVLVVLL